MSSTNDPEVITEKGVIHTNLPGGESADDLYTGIPGSAVTQNPEAYTTPPEGNHHAAGDIDSALQARARKAENATQNREEIDSDWRGDGQDGNDSFGKVPGDIRVKDGTSVATAKTEVSATDSNAAASDSPGGRGKENFRVFSEMRGKFLYINPTKYKILIEMG